MQYRHLLFIASFVSLLNGCASTPINETPPALGKPAIPSQEASTFGTGSTTGAPVIERIIKPDTNLPYTTTPPQNVPPSIPSTAYPSAKEGQIAVAKLLPRTSDQKGWATDIFSAFAALHIPATKENFCATIAVIEQESSFQSDPVVPGLSGIVWKEIDTRRKKYNIPELVLDAALLKSSPDGRTYKARINALKTEKQMNALFDDMISELPYGKTLLSGYNPIRTGGPMQVSVEFAESQVKEKPYPYPRKDSLRNEVFSRKGGLYFGIAILLDYPAPYSQPIYRFADFNAGRYSARNAAFQNAIVKITGHPLALDGDLLRYNNGSPSIEPSTTQLALYSLSKKLHLSEAEILRDIKQEKNAAFAHSPLYQRLFSLADQSAGKILPRETMPRINLKSPKIHRKLTTEWFANRVDMRYKTCLSR
ncbi:DUF1615 domain-containing protein [Sulfurirhabdus autotrophica]|uniref:Uncharacterized protein DUF1615 n=1 Tax=Sulfurirhabdus autotrophica TaxID=1706046 RepID=A0A4R3XUQ8_9PROT|nr:DUF1615 domain-containing protein [Sulfurirhabdus autotrophica]TCV82880.1 uncharacterized protein DUF1615 [Sulfurirhabdus autotrophica]